ncbi:VirB4-like conjugal transfer ATPase, CD1110 family [Clostridium cochlearium]|uniref:VirB4-like conjugal transfer ATPase, CD1110 family n=1 Tax=Clostridium cochlearium TaxID=1494 RepID=UPI00241D56E0|nr:DUF87 domain-containing protein [Clostridium cochlearium]MBE6065919.1 DUF87 domain-containing protein [Clostridium cochlearium]
MVKKAEFFKILFSRPPRKENKTKIVKTTAKEKDKERVSSLPKKKKKVIKVSKAIPKIKRNTIQTIPYEKMLIDNITLLEKNLYSKTWEWDDINYSMLKQEEQENIFIQYGKLLNYFNNSVSVQISIINKAFNVDELKSEILYDCTPDDPMYIYKKEYNNMLLSYMGDGKSNKKRKKYISLSINRDGDMSQIIQEFKSLEEVLISNFKTINSKIRPVTNYEKVKVLKEIFQGIQKPLPELSQQDFNRHIEKNYISPDYFSFKDDYFMFNNMYARVLFLRNLPSFLGDSMVNQISEIDSSMCLTININSVAPDEAVKVINRKLTAIEADKIKYVRKGRRNDIPDDILPRDLERSLKETRELLDDMMSRNEKIFRASLQVMIFDETYEGLEQKTDIIKSIASQNVCQMSELYMRQEIGMASCLPLGYDKMDIKRTLTTNSTAILNPFNVQELNTGNGIVYGINPRTNSIINANRKDLLNANGFILGTSGSGKSVSAKDELSQVYWKYKDDSIIIVDPQGEYTPIVNEYQGEVLKISADTTNFINPLDFSETYLSEEANPLSVKTNFMITLCEVCCGEISAAETSVIDRTMNIIYSKYFKTRNKEDIPTLVEFYKELLKQGETGEKLAIKMEIYCVGSQNIFAHKTNIDIHNRLFSYDISQLNGKLKNIGMLIMLENITNAIANNKAKGSFTWLFLDELHILLEYPQSAIYVGTLFKVIRKLNAIPTGITQNIEDLLKSEHGRKMLGNAEYVKLLKQKPQDRIQIAELLDISDSQIEYVSNADAGCGLIVWGDSIIPFKTKIPEKSRLLKLWGTSATDNKIAV